MKRNPTAFISFILIICFVLTSMSALASSPRKALIEEATNASCPPCAAANPGLEKFWSQTLDNVCPVTYHSSWPGATDPMYLDDQTINDIRIAKSTGGYYMVEGVPQAEFNGSPVAANDTVTLRNKLNAMLQSTPTSPITLKITTTTNGTNVSVKVVVSSDEDLSSKVLRVVATEFHHYYANAGNNGEKDFYYIAKKMLPTPRGTVINVTGGTSQEFTFTYQIKSTWSTPDMYITAFVQDDNTKEVLQAESNLQLASPEVSFDGSIYNRIGRNATVTKDFTVKNPTDVSMALTFTIDSAASSIPNNWKVTFNPTSATLATGKDTKVTMTIVTGPNAVYGVVSMKATPKTSKVNKAETVTNYYLTDDAKYAVYYGLSTFINWSASAFLSSTKLVNDAVALPMDMNMMQVWAPSDFDMIFIPEDYLSRIQGQVGYMEYTTLGTKFYSEINQMLNAGKSVLMTSELGLSDALGQYGSSMSRSFYSSTLGVTSGGTAPLRVTVSGNSITGMIPFTVKGVSSDADFKNISVTGNGGVWNQDAFVIQTDILKINSGSDATPIIFYDNKTTNIGGVKVVKGDGKLIYLTMGFEAIANATQRQSFMNTMVNWLATPVAHNAPTLESVSVLDFDSVAVKAQKDTSITIANTGNADLIITDIKIDLDDDNVFSLIDKPSLPATIKPESNIILKVRFNAKAEKSYTAVLAIDDNTSEEKHTIDLFAAGKNTSGVTDPSSNGTLALSAGPNPFQAETKVTLNVTGTDTQVEMYVLDATGREVAKLMNEKVTAGEYTKSLSGSGLSAGAYLIIAKANGGTVQLPVVLIH